MFTDSPATPARLEILVEVLRELPKGIKRQDLYRVLQPEPLAGVGTKFPIADAVVKAALDLGLAKQNGDLLISSVGKGDQPAKDHILAALDEIVLADVKVEYYFALYYAYYLGLGKQVYRMRNQDRGAWADQFNREVFQGTLPDNPFNPDKISGLNRWLSYTGLGWWDPAAKFQANPYERLRRSLPKIFHRAQKQESESFMKALAKACPELDGGEIFRRANPRLDTSDKKCTLGLSHALVDLHSDGLIRLNCPADSHGWSIEAAEPPRHGDFLSMRFASVELGRNN